MSRGTPSRGESILSPFPNPFASQQWARQGQGRGKQVADPSVRLIAHPKDRVDSLSDVQALPFFTDIPFASLRSLSAPFVPVLDGETDVGYFDSFSSPEDMAKYAEVFKKQRDVEAVQEKGSGDRNNWVGFTFGKNHGVSLFSKPPNHLLSLAPGISVHLSSRGFQMRMAGLTGDVARAAKIRDDQT